MKQCEYGHIFDEKTHAACPYCNQAGLLVVRPLESGIDLSFTNTVPLNTSSAPDFPKTALLNTSSAPDFPKTTPLDTSSAPTEQAAPAHSKMEMSATAALNVSDTGIAPVCGWLVVAEGDNKGLSFPVNSEKNTIGRGSNFDVNLSFDKAVSKEGDAVLNIGSKSEPMPDVNIRPLVPRSVDQLLICSDGFWEHIYEYETEADFLKSESAGTGLNICLSGIYSAQKTAAITLQPYT